MHPRLSVNAMCSFGWSFDQDLALWSELEVRHAGLLVSKLSPHPEQKMAQLTDAGICASTLITEAFNLLDTQSWERTQASHRAAIDLIADHGGRSIYFTPGRTTCISWQEDFDRLAEAIAPTVAHARDRGIRAAIEPSLRTSVSFVNTLRDAIDVAERTGADLIADFGNMWMERDFRETVRRAAPNLALVQIGDIVIGSPGRPSPGGRVHVGRGELPLRRMIRDVIDAGYQGLFDLEVVGTDLAADCDGTELRRGIVDASTLLDELAI